MEPQVSEIVFIIIAATALLLLLTGFVIFMIFFHRNKQLRNRQEKQELKNNYEKAILESRAEMQEETFRQVGYELHDNVAQLLSLIKMNLNVDATPEVAEAKKLVAHTIQEVRELSHRLNLDWAEHLTLSDFLQEEVRKLRNTDLQVSISDHIAIELPDLDRKVLIFRMIQELIQNVLKHAESDQLILKTSSDSGRKKLEIRDNGKGFEPESTGKGLGLSTLRKRAALAGIDIELRSRPGEGSSAFLYF